MKKFFYITFLLSLFWTYQSLYSQLKPFIKNNGIYSYFIGKTEPPAGWKSVNFNDSAWDQSDSSIIGYNWSPIQKKRLDSVNIEKTSSLYIRIKLDVDDPALINDLNFEADYDDAFIAYFNGIEIARKNIGKPGDTAFYNTLAERSHDATVYRGYYAPINGIYIDEAIVKSLIKKGKNVFAIHVMNDKPNGDDLSFLLNVYNLGEMVGFNYAAQWVKYYRQVNLDSSKFPIVIINTDKYGIPNASDIPTKNIKKQVTATMSIIRNEVGFNYVSDKPEYNGFIGLERRGQSSRDFAKMCFNVETHDSLGNNLDTAIMGMPSDNDWVLNSNYGDKTILRTELTFCIGRQLGHYEPRTQYCELILNGEYQGLYVFMEKIRRSRDRVKVAKRDSINPAEGGYIFRYDKDFGYGAVDMVYPKDNEITKQEKDYLLKFISDYTAVLKSNKFLDSLEGYKKYISGKSLIDNIIINELTKNCDAYYFSTYFHKDKVSDDGRIKYGPLWDYDLAYCGAWFQNGDKTNGWQFAEPTSGALNITSLFRDTALTYEFARKWKELRRGILSDENFYAKIDSIANYIEESRIINYQVWPIIDKSYLWPVVPTSSYDDDVNLIKDWTSERMKWIDDNIDKIYYAPLNNPTPQFSNTRVNVYPNPFAEHLNIKFSGENGSYSASITSMDGKIICTKNINIQMTKVIEFSFSSDELSKLTIGVYFLLVKKEGQIVHVNKLVKSNL